MPPGTVAIVPARDEAESISDTLLALTAIPEVHRIVVVDDGSTDGTADIARASDADVIRPRSGRGKGAALLAGLALAREDTRFDSVLLADADLGETAYRLAVLLKSLENTPVAIAAFPASVAGKGGFGLVKRFARRGIKSRTGFRSVEPLSGQRAISRAALELLPGIAPGFGAEVGMTLDFLSKGVTPLEVPVELSHRPTGKTLSGFLHRAGQGLDIARALRGERLEWRRA